MKGKSNNKCGRRKNRATPKETQKKTEVYFSYYIGNF